MRNEWTGGEPSNFHQQEGWRQGTEWVGCKTEGENLRPIISPDAGKDWRQKEKRAAEDEMVKQHHWLSGHEFEQTFGDSEGQGSMVCCSLCGPKESDTIEWLNNLACRWCAPQQPEQDPAGCQDRAGRQQVVPYVPQKIAEVFLEGKMSLTWVTIMSPVDNIRQFTAGAKCWDMVCKCHKQLRIGDWRWG